MDLEAAIAELDKKIMDMLDWVQQYKTGNADEDMFLEQGFITYGGMSKSLLQMKELGNLTNMERAALEVSMGMWKEILSKVSGKIVNG